MGLLGGIQKMRYSTRVLVVAAAIGFLCLTFDRAVADEQLLPLAESGDWIAMEHTDSITSAPDVCFAATSASGRVFAVRAAESDLEVRFSDDSWSLPAGVTGTLAIAVGSYHAAFDISDNTNKMVTAEITLPQLQSLIAAMDKASSMTVTPGKSSPVAVSLNGSNTATTAFLTCAGLTAPGEGGGANPFQ